MEDIIYPEEQKTEWRKALLAKYKKKVEQPTKIYLASPYSHKVQLIRDRRFILVSFLAAQLTKQGYNVYSPILNGYIMSQYAEFPQTYDFWEARDKQFIVWCAEFWMLKLDGWQDSTGMPRELNEARLLGRPIKEVTISTGLTEREFIPECSWWHINRAFTDKVKLEITVKESR